MTVPFTIMATPISPITMTASLHQFGTACQSIVFYIYQLFLELVYLYHLLLAGVAVMDIEQNKNHDEDEQLRLTTEKVRSQNVTAYDVL